MQYHAVLIFMHYFAVLASMKRQRESNRRKLGDAIRARRNDLGLSQEKLAELVDCHRNYVGLVERGEHNLTVDMLCRFAGGLGCSVADLTKDARL
jgi:transcriptional regulator with XRE-family HTH domain